MPTDLYLPLLRPVEPEYRCPGEGYGISRSVHLARMAAGYPPCRTCQYHHETGELPAEKTEWLNRPASIEQRRSLFTPTGVRGVYLNEINRQLAGSLAGALARLLWERHPPSLKPFSPSTESDPPSEKHTFPATENPHQIPLVLVGHDERPHSPDLMTGVIQVLRRMSCGVLDARRVARPWFERLLQEHRARAGIYLGAGSEGPAWSGMNFYLEEGLPCTDEFILPELEATYQEGLQRPSRSSSGHRTLSTGGNYAKLLHPLFHALRPLKIVVGCAHQEGSEILRSLLSSTACQFLGISLPRRKNDWRNKTDTDHQRIRSVIEEQGAHLGCLIDEDLQTTVCFDEQGNVVSAEAMASIVTEVCGWENPEGTIVVSDRFPQSFIDRLSQRKQPVHVMGGGETSMVRGMHEKKALLGLHPHRTWFREGGVAADGLMLLGMMLQSLSRSDLELSAVCQQVDSIVKTASGSTTP